MLAAEAIALDARLAAGVLLAAYLSVAAVLLPRELTFLKGVEQPFRRRFIAIDLLIQACVLAVLLPNILCERLNMVLLYVIVTAFSVLWLAAAINARWRYIYTYTYLLKSMAEQHQQLMEQIKHKRRAERGDD